MDWLNIHTSTLDSPEFVGSTPTERSTWLCLQRFCIGQENGGVIAGARLWKDRQWQQLACVTLREVSAAAKLWKWQGDDLLVEFYPVGAESEVRAKREGGRATAAKRWGCQTHSSPDSSATSSPSGSAHAKGKERKGNEKESIPPTPAATASEEKQPRARNELLDCLATVGGGSPLEVPPSRWSAVQRCLRDIKAVTPNVTSAEIARRAANYRTHFRDAVVTPEALMKHWPMCENASAAEQFGRREKVAGWNTP